MIDTTKPVCGTKSHSTTWTNSNRTVSVKCSDATSGCKQASYSATYNDSNTKNKVVKTANITIKDKAGNSNSCSMNVYVDKQKPTCTVSGGSTSWTGGNRTVTINCNDGSGSGCKVSSFKDTVTTTTKTKTYTVEDNAGILERVQQISMLIRLILNVVQFLVLVKVGLLLIELLKLAVVILIVVVLVIQRHKHFLLPLLLQVLL